MSVAQAFASLSLAVVAGCGAVGVPCKNDSTTAWANAELHAPAAQRAADDYFTLWNTPLHQCEAERARWLFANEFFAGVIRPGSTLHGSDSEDLRAMNAARRAGAEYRHRASNSLDSTMAEFGYTPYRGIGVWTTSSESTSYRPSDSHEDETWWLEAFADDAVTFEHPKDFGTYDWPVALTGYVSKEGAYGNGRAYKRKVIASVIARRQ